MKLFNKIDRYIETFVHTPHTRVVVFFIAFFEATISPILPEAFLALILAYRKDISWKILSFFSALGSAFGSIIMYLFGYFLYDRYGRDLLSFINGNDFVERAKTLFGENVFVAQFLASLTPLPDRVFSFLAGAFAVSLPLVFFATFFGRFIRASVVAYLSYEYGDEARVYIKRHTKTVAIICVIGVVAYGVYKTIF